METCWKFITENENFVAEDEFVAGVTKLYACKFNPAHELALKQEALTRGPSALLVSYDPSTGTNPNVRHFVILALEHASFDRVFGRLNNERHNGSSTVSEETSSNKPGELDGLTGLETNLMLDDETLISVSGSVAQSRVNVFPQTLENVDMQIGAHADTKISPSMTGFVKAAQMQLNSEERDKLQEVMSGFDEASIPVLTALAKEYAVFDSWFSSVPASSDGDMTDNFEKLLAGYPQQSIFQSLHESEVSWKNYYEDVPISSLMFRWTRKKGAPHFAPLKQFFEDAKEGKLPQLSVLDYKYQVLPYCAGESMTDSGARTFVTDMAEIVTFDNHGGFYDHVPPPVGIPNPDGKPFAGTDVEFNFDRLGVRVPTLLVSPWVAKGSTIKSTVSPTSHRSEEDAAQSLSSKQHFEHSSIPATIKKQFKLSNFFNDRDQSAATFETCFTSLSSPRKDTLPSLPSVIRKEDQASDERKESELWKSLAKFLAGSQKPSRENLLAM
ncbi:hypothetical protein HK102_012766 [Quaeritorhiza haematococci]|nr:hypothetical protein HK102_012766 [Quaeritorhiza haematococci]